jgi:hypothetical protein
VTDRRPDLPWVVVDGAKYAISGGARDDFRRLRGGSSVTDLVIFRWIFCENPQSEYFCDLVEFAGLILVIHD